MSQEDAKSESEDSVQLPEIPAYHPPPPAHSNNYNHPPNHEYRASRYEQFHATHGGPPPPPSERRRRSPPREEKEEEPLGKGNDARLVLHIDIGPQADRIAPVALQAYLFGALDTAQERRAVAMPKVNPPSATVTVYHRAVAEKLVERTNGRRFGEVARLEVRLVEESQVERARTVIDWTGHVRLRLSMGSDGLGVSDREVWALLDSIQERGEPRYYNDYERSGFSVLFSVTSPRMAEKALTLLSGQWLGNSVTRVSVEDLGRLRRRSPADRHTRRRYEDDDRRSHRRHRSYSYSRSRSRSRSPRGHHSHRHRDRSRSPHRR
ncbi:splicing factor TSR1 [Angomonas deanei]|uniref:Uncharacterized protein n=1 Tax=Angomonas deanei TaxID=59799 RepID=A0A7G2CUV8_9TRYP|nr:splicing factor TSR1 [Angomonas deanei]CAD2222072.1 hypothetical protein, conserved [Angomonas deanei]|eukprot:EPY20585.1 splicing factor TSR1 [Angomonas deanei]